jgi:hypothetical protein
MRGVVSAGGAKFEGGGDYFRDLLLAVGILGSIFSYCLTSLLFLACCDTCVCFLFSFLNYAFGLGPFFMSSASMAWIPNRFSSSPAFHSSAWAISYLRYQTKRRTTKEGKRIKKMKRGIK